MDYDVVGEIDQLGDGVRGFQVGNRVADMTVIGSNAAYCTLRSIDLTRVPTSVDAAEAATLILSWTTAYQLLHRAARVQRGQRVLVQGAAGAVGQALLALGRLVGLELWGTARGAHAALIRELGATPIDYQPEDFTRVLPGGFDVVFDGIGEDDYGRSFAALKRGGLLCAFGYTAGVQPQRRLLAILMWSARVHLWRRLLSWLPGGKRLCVYSINAMRALHPAWFREDLERLFSLLAVRAIRPRVCRAHLFRRGCRGTPPDRGRRSRWQAGAVPGPAVATRPGSLVLRSGNHHPAARQKNCFRPRSLGGCCRWVNRPSPVWVAGRKMRRLRSFGKLRHSAAAHRNRSFSFL
jgi:NADPH:quinone reductase-like Zn-dependent oxidoreductase